MDYAVLTTKSVSSGSVFHHVIKTTSNSSVYGDRYEKSCVVSGERIFTTKDLTEALEKIDELRSIERDMGSKVVSAETFNKLRIDAELEKDLEEARQKRRFAKGKGDSSSDN